MGGGLLNIVAYGNQNVILNGNPSKTFFKTVYAKYTNFGIQKFRIDFEGSRSLNEETDSVYTFKIPRHGDLLLDSYLAFNLPDIYSPILPPLTKGDVWKPYHFKWIENIGTSIIKNIKIMIGTNIIQEYNGEYIRCVVERDFSEAKKKTFDIMTGNTEEFNGPEFFGGRRLNNYPNVFYNPSITGSEPSIRGRKIYVPLNPWYMNDSKVALPLICLQYSELTIEVTLRPIKEIFTINNVNGVDVVTNNDTQTNNDNLNNNGEFTSYNYNLDYEKNIDKLYDRKRPNFSNENEQMYNYLQQPPTIELDRNDYTNKENNWNADIHLISSMCFLTKEESNIFANNEQKILIRDIKYTTFYNITGSARVKLDTNALVSSWLWFYRRNDIYNRNEWSNYTNWKTRYIPYELLDGEEVTPFTVTFDANGEPIGAGIGPGRDYNILTDDVNQRLVTNHQITPNFSIQNTKKILNTFSIIIDGKYRENELDSGIYDHLEKYRSSKGCSSDLGIYSYNFCINTGAENLQPSGAMNLSRFKNIELEMTTLVPESDPNSTTTTLCDEDGGIIGVIESESLYLYSYEMHLYEERYNILRIMSGNAGLLFAR